MNFTNLKNKIFILVFLAILVFPWVGGDLLRLFTPDLFSKLSLVETENRQMAEIKWSELLSTGESVSSYVDDRIPFRYSLITAYKALNDGIEDRYQVAETAIGNKFYKEQQTQTVELDKGKTNKPIVPAEEVPQETETAQADNGYFPLNVYQDVIIAKDGWLFLYGENEFECYQGTNILDDSQMATYAAKINELQSLCNARGKELYIYIAPNKSQVYPQYMPTVDIVNTFKREQRLHEYINENCTTPYLYPLNEMFYSTSQYQTYYKCDSHWNHIGALYGTNALYGAMGVEQTNPADWVVGTQDAEKYELYTYMGIPDEMIDHYDIECTVDYRPTVTVNGLDMDAMVCRTTSDGANQKKLCLIGDSFRVNMMPYLSKDFTSCTFAHRDYMTRIHSDIKNSDVIVIEAVERYDYEAIKTVQRVINVLKDTN